ncbi:MAG: DUF6447 family protein, partial [Lamprobacter sp.]|uniref:hypothetical protein n=1 Tax=Lamprobacter sp. TaxID=3100796 RepID=UPI002B25F5BD
PGAIGIRPAMPGSMWCETGVDGRARMSAVANPNNGREIPLSELPELTPWLEQRELKQQLLAQSGGGEAFVALAVPLLKRHILSTDPYKRASADHGQLKALLRRGTSIDEIAHAFAVAWLHEADRLQLPRRALSDRPLLIYGIPLLALGVTLITVALAVFEAHPRWMGPFIYTAPLFMLLVAPLFWLLIKAWRGALRGADAVITGPSTAVVDLAPSEGLDRDQPWAPLSLDSQAATQVSPLTDTHSPAADQSASVLPSVSDPLSTDSARQVALSDKPKAAPNPLTPLQTPDEALSEAQMTDQPQTLTIDGTDYPIADLSEAAQQQVTNLRVCDQEIQRLQQQLGIAQTARAAYANALKAELPSKPVAH